MENKKTIKKNLRNSLFKITIIVFVSNLFMSCMSMRPTTYNVSMEKDYNEAFVGAHHNAIVKSFGAPNRQVTDGAGGTILIYEEIITTSQSNSIATAYNVNYYTKTYTPGSHTNTVTTQNISYLHIFVDADGVCYRVKTNHQKTVVDEEAVEYNKKANEKNAITEACMCFGFLGVALTFWLLTL